MHKLVGVVQERKIAITIANNKPKEMKKSRKKKLKSMMMEMSIPKKK
jgi:hypothetical protein